MSYMDMNSIDWTRTGVLPTKVGLSKYDMYYIQVALKNGSKRNIRVFTDKNDIPNFNTIEYDKFKKIYENELWNFFIRRLFGSDGLMAKEKREDFIYLGRFGRNGAQTSRFMREANGRTSQENFDADLFKLKMQVQTKEHELYMGKTNNRQVGKHYAISDAHGMYGSYLDAISRLNKNDSLFILGDVIDRGDEGIKILLDIMGRQKNPYNNPKIEFLLGNHEFMLLQTIQIMLNYGLNSTDIINLTRYKGDIEGFYRTVKQKGITPYEVAVLDNWININHGDKTIFSYLNDLNPYQKKDVYNFLMNSYLMLPQKIDGKDFLLVHAMPIDNRTILEQMKRTGKGFKVNELTPKDRGFILSERNHETYRLAQYFGFTTICGHTPRPGTIIQNKDEGYVRIDAACGQQRQTSRLALYCIEDDRVEYISEKRQRDVNPYR